MPCFSSDFLLEGQCARSCYRERERKAPVLARCDISFIRALAEDRLYQTVTDFFLRDDPTRQMLMRLAGVEERFITGDGSDYEKFRFFCTVMGDSIGSLAWLHAQAELRILLDCPLDLCAKHCDEIWQKTGAMFATERVTARTVVRRCGIEALLVVLPPDDELSLLEKVGREMGIAVLPIFCPDTLLDVQGNFAQAVHRLCEITGVEVDSLEGLGRAIGAVLDRFAAAGCKAAVHTVWPCRFQRPDPYHADMAVKKILVEGISPNEQERAVLCTQLWRILGIEYRRRNMLLELPSGGASPMRNAVRVDGAPARIPYRTATQLLEYLSSCAGLPRVALYVAEPGEVPDMLTLVGRYANPQGPDGAGFSFGLISGTDRQMRSCTQMLMAANRAEDVLGAYPDFRLSTSLLDGELFCRTLCNLFAEREAFEELKLPQERAEALLRRVCYENMKRLHRI